MLVVASAACGTNAQVVAPSPSTGSTQSPAPPPPTSSVLVLGLIRVQAVNTFAPLVATVVVRTFDDHTQQFKTAPDGYTLVRVPMGRPLSVAVSATGYLGAEMQFTPTGDFARTFNLGRNP